MPKPFKNLLAPTATIFVLVPNEIVVNNNAINKTKETTVRNLFLNKTPLIPRPNFLIFFKNAKESRYAFDFLFSLQKEAELPTVCLSVCPSNDKIFYFSCQHILPTFLLFFLIHLPTIYIGNNILIPSMSYYISNTV